MLRYFNTICWDFLICFKSNGNTPYEDLHAFLRTSRVNISKYLLQDNTFETKILQKN